jgi:hypothetical protein
LGHSLNGRQNMCGETLLGTLLIISRS